MLQMIEQELRQALTGLIEFVTGGPFPHLISEPGHKPTQTAQSKQSLPVSFLRIKPFLESANTFLGKFTDSPLATSKISFARLMMWKTHC